jgi:hypothetical protein
VEAINAISVSFFEFPRSRRFHEQMEMEPDANPKRRIAKIVKRIRRG